MLRMASWAAGAQLLWDTGIHLDVPTGVVLAAWMSYSPDIASPWGAVLHLGLWVLQAFGWQLSASLGGSK